MEMAHVKHIWDGWRYDLNRFYIKSHNGDESAIKANVPEEFSVADWNYLFDRHYFNANFKKKSARNAANRQDVSYVHHTGNKPFSQVEREMEKSIGRVLITPSYS